MSTQNPTDNLFTWPSDSPKLIGSKDTKQEDISFLLKIQIIMKK